MNESALDYMKRVQDKLDKFEKDKDIPLPSLPGSEDELNKYLSMNRTEIEALSPTDCGIINVRLKQFSLYIQRIYNKQLSIVKFCESEIRRYVSGKLEQFDKWTKHENKVQAIANTDEYLNTIIRIKNEAEQRCTRLEGININMQGLGSAFLNIKKNKEGER